MHDCLWLVLLKYATDLRRFADINLLEHVAWALRDGSRELEDTRIRELIYINHDSSCLGDQVANQRGTNEARATRDHYCPAIHDMPAVIVLSSRFP